MNQSLKVLRTYISEDAAVMDRLYLQASGVETVIEADDCGSMTPYLHMSQGVRLFVREEDLEQASELLQSAENTPDSAE